MIPTHDVLEARWQAIVTRPREYPGESEPMQRFGIDNSKDWYRLERIVRRWALTVVGDPGPMTEDEAAALEDLTGQITEDIHRRVIEYAALLNPEARETT